MYFAQMKTANSGSELTLSSRPIPVIQASLYRFFNGIKEKTAYAQFDF